MARRSSDYSKEHSPPLSQRGYARHRKKLGLPGHSLSSVQKAIATGRIPTIKQRGRVLIDPEIADQEWEANTQAQITGPAGKTASGSRRKGNGQPETRAYGQARARKEQAAATKLELELGKMQSDLISATEVRSEYDELGRRLRNRLLSIPARIASQVAATKSPKEAEALLDEEIRTALLGFAEEETGG